MDVKSGGARKRLVPLLWDGDVSAETDAFVAPLDSVGKESALARTPINVPRRVPPGGSPPRPIGGMGGATVGPDGSTLLLQRAVKLRDDAVAKPLQIKRVKPLAARTARLVPHDSAKLRRVKSNEVDIVARRHPPPHRPPPPFSPPTGSHGHPPYSWPPTRHPPATHPPPRIASEDERCA